jgi:hypothetical protein
MLSIIWTGGLGGSGDIAVAADGYAEERNHALATARRVERAASPDEERAIYVAAGYPAVAAMWPEASVEEQCRAVDILRPWQVYRGDRCLDSCVTEQEATESAQHWQEADPVDWVYRVKNIPDPRGKAPHASA